jgi:hypothetical protein
MAPHWRRSNRGAKKQDKRAEHVLGNPKPAKNNIEKNIVARPSYDEVLAAVSSLYDDDLKPVGRILRKRIAERIVFDSLGSMTSSIVKVDKHLPDAKYVRELCEGSATMRVQSEEGGDWSAMLLDRPHSFIDIYSPSDKYSAQLWDSLSSYFSSAEGSSTFLPGGRYSCAKVLCERSLPFLRDYSLGQVCHIIQLAMSQKKILGYWNGSIVPYARSQSKMKAECAMFSVPCLTCGKEEPASGENTQMQTATWGNTRQYLQEILADAPETAEGNRCVPLSNVKRLFRSKYNTLLSETMLGYMKLSELLQDPQLSDVCTVRLGDYGYIVVQVAGDEAGKIESAPFEANTTESTNSFESDLGSNTDHSVDLVSADASELQETAPIGISPDRLNFDDVGNFLSLCTLTSPEFEDEEPQRRFQFCSNEPLEGIEEIPSSPETKAHPSRLESGWIGSIALSKVRNTFIHSPLPPPTPLRNSTCRRARSVPKDVGSGKNHWETACQALCASKIDNRERQHEFNVNESSTPSVYGSYDLTAMPSPALTASPVCFRSYSPFLRNTFFAPTLSNLDCHAPLSPSSKVVFLTNYFA